MPKIKTHSGAKKRFNLTKSGKIKRAHAYKSPHTQQEDHTSAREASAREPTPTLPTKRAIKQHDPCINKEVT